MISAYLLQLPFFYRWEVAFMGSTQALSTREALQGQALSKQKEHTCLLKLPMDTEGDQILYYHLILIPSKWILSERLIIPK